MNPGAFYAGLVPEPPKLDPLDQAVMEHARLLEAHNEFQRFGEHCWLSAIGISAPTNAELSAARRAVVDRAREAAT